MLFDIYGKTGAAWRYAFSVLADDARAALAVARARAPWLGGEPLTAAAFGPQRDVWGYGS